MNKDQRHNKKRLNKTVSFLRKEHKDLIEHINKLDDFGRYVRELIKKDIEKCENQ